MAPDLGRRLLAEAIGTALLVIFGAGAPGEGVPVGAPGDSPRGTGRFQGTAGDIEGERD